MGGQYVVSEATDEGGDDEDLSDEDEEAVAPTVEAPPVAPVATGYICPAKRGRQPFNHSSQARHMRAIGRLGQKRRPPCTDRRLIR